MKKNKKRYCCEHCVDGEKIPYDIALGTSPQDAYIRTNMKLKDETERLDKRINDTNRSVDDMSENFDSSINILQESIDHELSALSKRVDHIIAHNGDTNGNTELTDIRVGTDGFVYGSAGTAVREQLNMLRNDLESFFDKETSANLFNKNECIENFGINAQGSLYEDNSLSTSNFIEVEEDKTYAIFVNINGRMASCYTSRIFGYGTNKEPVQSLGATSFSYNEVSSFTIPEGVKYIRFSTAASSIVSYDIMLAETDGTIPTEIIPYVNINLIKNTDYVRHGEYDQFTQSTNNILTSHSNDINYLKQYAPIDTKEKDFFQIEKNVYTTLGMTDGYIINNANGELILSDDVSTTDFLDITGFQTIYRSMSPLAAFYDKNRNFISGVAYGVKEITVPLGAKYFRSGVMTEYKNLSSNYIANVNYKPENGKLNITDQNLFDGLKKFVADHVAEYKIFSDKKWALIGDSYTDANAASLADHRYFDWIADITGIGIMQNLAKSGSGWKRKESSEDGNCAFYQQALLLESDIDLVTIFGGGNDCSQSYTIGNYTDNTTDTLCGAVNATISNIYAQSPNAHIIVFSPTPWAGYYPYDGNDGGKMGQLVTALKQVCSYRGIKFVDLFHSSGLRPQNPQFKSTYYNSDGVHPNNNGHKWIYPRFLSAIKDVLPITQ